MKTANTACPAQPSCKAWPCASFIYGGDSDSKADLDEIIRLATAGWAS